MFLDAWQRTGSPDKVHYRKQYTDISQDGLAFFVRHGVSLVEIAHRRADFAVRSAKLQKQIAHGYLLSMRNIVSQTRWFVDGK